MYRPRVGEKLITCAGARYGEFVWCDEGGEYEVDADFGVSTYFFHRVELMADGSLRLRCKDWRRTCPVKAKVSHDGEIIWMKERHNHHGERNGHGLAYYKCRTDWITDIRKKPREPPRKSILKARRTLSTEEARTVVLEQQARTARWHAAHVRPTSVRSLLSLHLRISCDPVPGYTISQTGERLLSFYFAVTETVILTTKRQLELVHHADMLHSDATYQTTPRRLCKQIFSIHGNFQGHVEIILCALMKKCDADSYKEIFQFLKRQTRDDILRAYMGDFDTAIRKAVLDEFPNARRFGCHFHYSQALVRKASSPRVGLSKEIRKPADTRSKDILKKFIGFTALPLLPANEIQPMFLTLRDEALQASPKFRSLVDYIESFWLGAIGVNELSLFDVPNGCRTNNAVESWHAKLKKEVGAHPATWNLIAALNDFCSDAPTNIEIRGEGIAHVVSKPNRHARKNADRIRDASRLLQQGAMTPHEFINAVKYRMGGAAVRRGLCDEDGCFKSDVSEMWDPYMENLIAIMDHDYDTKRAVDPLGDHDYIRFVNCPPDHNYARQPACEDVHGVEAGIVKDVTVADRGDVRGESGNAHDNLPDDHGPDNADNLCKDTSNPQIPSITDEMCETIDEVLSDESDRVLLYINGNELTRKDLKSLEGLNWLNDTIIDVYLSLIVRRSTESSNLPRVYAYSSFFLQAFEQWNYDGVRKWTKGHDIFKNDILLIPVFTPNHWSMIIVDLRYREIKFMDSMGRKNSECLDMVLDYLDYEHDAKNGRPLNYDDWHLTNVENLPLQKNGSDCGMFALKYADYGAQDANINFAQEDMPYFRRRMILEMLRSDIYPTGYGKI